MKNKILIILVSILLCIGFFYFTLVVKSKILNSFDFNTTVRIQNHIPLRYDPILSFFSLIGSFEVIICLLMILFIIRKKIKAFFILPIFLLAHFIEFLGKLLFNHPGPPFMFFRYTIPFLFPSSYVQPGSSYPSGHSLRIIFIAIIIGYMIMKIKRLSKIIKLLLQLLLMIFVTVMLITRISLGEHWTTDVIAGSLLGGAFGFFSLLFL